MTQCWFYGWHDNLLDSRLRDFQNVIVCFLYTYFFVDLILLEFINQVNENLLEDYKLERHRYQKENF